jgi:hypothetical protein
MQTTSTPAPMQLASTHSTDAAAGPRLLDPSEFQFVSGGAPRNGWLAPVAATTVVTSAAPRNGW